MKAEITVSSKSPVEEHNSKCCTHSKGIASGSNVSGGSALKVDLSCKLVEGLASDKAVAISSDNIASTKAPGKLETRRARVNESLKPDASVVPRQGPGKVVGRTSKIVAESSSVAVESARAFPVSVAQQSSGVGTLQTDIQVSSKSIRGKGQPKFGGEKSIPLSAHKLFDTRTTNHVKSTVANCGTPVCQPVTSFQGVNGTACCHSWNFSTSKVGVATKDCIPVTSARKFTNPDVAQTVGTIEPAQTVTTASAVDNCRRGQFITTQKQAAIVKLNPRDSGALVSSMPSDFNQNAPFVGAKNTVGASNGVSLVVSSAAPCSAVENGFKPSIPASLPASSASFSRPAAAVVARVPENFPELVPSDRKMLGRLDADVSDVSTGKNKKSRRKAKGKDGLTAVGKSGFDFIVFFRGRLISQVSFRLMPLRCNLVVGSFCYIWTQYFAVNFVYPF
jgi:hypothetical protein